MGSKDVKKALHPLIQIFIKVGEVRYNKVFSVVILSSHFNSQWVEFRIVDRHMMWKLLCILVFYRINIIIR
jgi:hypothetical protein